MRRTRDAQGASDGVSDAVTASTSHRLTRSIKRRAKRLWRAVDESLILGPRITLSTWWQSGRHHTAPIAPLRTLAVDPQTIDRWVDMEIEDYRRIRYRFGVRDGPWDLATVPLDEHFVYTSLEARFQRGAEWADTHLYRVAIAGFQGGSGRYHGCRTLSDLEHRLARIDELYERIERDGYRTQAEMRRSDGAIGTARRSRPTVLDEVVVHVGREGQFLLVDGVHRFSIARLQGIASIPVIVLLRHTEWQKRRDAVATGREVTRPGDEHPDLVGIGRRR